MQKIDAKTLNDLIANLAKNHSIRELYLSRCNLSDADGVRLLKAVEKSHVKSLDLSHNGLSVAFFRALPHFVTQAGLVELNVDGNDLSSKEAVQCLNKAIESSRTLKDVIPRQPLNAHSVGKMNKAAIEDNLNSNVKTAIDLLEKKGGDTIKDEIQFLKRQLQTMLDSIIVPDPDQEMSNPQESKTKGFFHK